MSKEKGLTIYLTPHSHYDYLWCDTPDGMGSKNAKLIKEALMIMRKHDDYRYVIDSVMACEYFRLNYPELWDELKQRIKEGKVEMIGGDIIAPDSLMPSGEALVRQFLYGCRYFKKHFEVDSKIGYLIDSFGQTPQLPQILKKAGLDYFVFVRGARNRSLPQEFWWKALDGSKVLTHWMYSTYTYLFPPFCPTILPPHFPFFPIPGSIQFVPQTFKIYELICKLFPPFKFLFRRFSNTKLGVSLMGYDMGGLKLTIKNRTPRSTTNNLFILNGTDNLPPSTNTIDAVDYYNRINKKNKIKTALPSEFFTAVKKDRKKFSVVESYEFLGPPDLFPGTFSNRPKLKQKIRSLENIFYLTELIGTLASVYSDYEYPNKDIEKAIVRIIRCDFHDGICGCCVDAAYDHMMKQLRLTQLELNRIYNEAIGSFIKVINTSSIPKGNLPVLILNPLAWERNEIVELNLINDMKDIVVLDQDGKIIPHQKDIINENKNRILFKVKDLLPIGCKLYSIKQEKSTKKEEAGSKSEKTNDFIIENDLLKLEFKEGKLISVFNKKNSYEITSIGVYSIGDLRIHNDRGDSYFSGHVGKTHVMYDHQAKIIEQGPVRTVVKQTSKLRCTSKLLFKPINEITQYIIIPNTGEPRIDFFTTFYNKIRNIRVQACFPTSIPNPAIRSEVPYGFYERDIKPKFGKSWWESNKRFEHYDRIKPVINWMDFSNKSEKKGITIVNNGMPEYEIGKNKDVCFLTLFRSTGVVGNFIPFMVPWIAAPFYRMPKGYALGEQSFQYSIYLHNGDFESNSIAKKALNHNIPIVAQITDINKGKLASEFNLFSVKNANFMVTAIKSPEDGDSGLIIRLLEISGKKSKGTIIFNQKVKSVKEINLLEQPIHNLKIESENAFSFNSNPQEIKSFLIEF